MRKLFQLLIMIICLLNLKAAAQDSTDLLSGVPDSSLPVSLPPAFKSTRIIMAHSVKMLSKGVLDFRILHRFGPIDEGASTFFGLDQATIRLGLDYGLSDRFTIGIGRSSYKKEIDGFLKWQAVSSKNPKFPLSLVAVAGSTLIGAPWANPNRDNLFSSRMGYYFQVLAGAALSKSISLQLTPTILHQNLVTKTGDDNDLKALGLGGRWKISKRSSINVDYFHVFNQRSAAGLYDPLSIGFDIETGGHVFQLHVTNASGMNERAFLAETVQSWGDGSIAFGFNISRAFQISHQTKASKSY